MTKEQPKRKTSKFKLALFIYAMAVTYPAYVQVNTWTNAALDVWAEERVGMTKQEASDLDKLAEAMPEYLKQPLPMRKP